MKAYVVRQLGMPDSHQVIDWASPAPQPGHVVIRVRAAGVNFPDMLMVQGKYQHTPPVPFIPGHEVAGDIMAMGDGVTGYRAGDRVVAFMRHGGFGAFCTETLVKADHFLAKLPDEVSYVAAASMPLAYGTAFHALRKGRVKPGDKVLILGASGGVGLATVQIAKLLGARVIACASSEEKLATCRAHGADETVNYETADLRAEIRRLTADRGLDVAIDPVGDKYAEPVVRGMAWGGRYVIVGFAGGQIPRIPLNLVLLKGCELIGIGVGVNADKDCTEYVQNQDQMLQWVAQEQLRPVVSATYPLERTAGALADIIARKVQGKIVLTMP
jgi:NADPH2:quinone reductase